MREIKTYVDLIFKAICEKYALDVKDQSVYRETEEYFKYFDDDILEIATFNTVVKIYDGKMMSTAFSDFFIHRSQECHEKFYLLLRKIENMLYNKLGILHAIEEITGANISNNNQIASMLLPFIRLYFPYNKQFLSFNFKRALLQTGNVRRAFMSESVFAYIPKDLQDEYVKDLARIIKVLNKYQKRYNAYDVLNRWKNNCNIILRELGTEQIVGTYKDCLEITKLLETKNILNIKEHSNLFKNYTREPDSILIYTTNAKHDELMVYELVPMH